MLRIDFINIYIYIDKQLLVSEISYGRYILSSTLAHFTSLTFRSFIHNIYRIHIGSFRSHGSKIAGILRAIYFRSESRNIDFLEDDETVVKRNEQSEEYVSV